MNFPFENETFNDTYYIYRYDSPFPTTMLPLIAVTHPYSLESIVRKHKKLINKFNYDIVE